MLAITDWEGEYGLPANIVKGGIPISGVFDLRPFRHSWLQPKLLLTHEVIEQQSPLFHFPQDGKRNPGPVKAGAAPISAFKSSLLAPTGWAKKPMSVA